MNILPENQGLSGSVVGSSVIAGAMLVVSVGRGRTVGWNGKTVELSAVTEVKFILRVHSFCDK